MWKIDYLQNIVIISYLKNIDFINMTLTLNNLKSVEMP